MEKNRPGRSCRERRSLAVDTEGTTSSRANTGRIGKKIEGIEIDRGLLRGGVRVMRGSRIFGVKEEVWNDLKEQKEELGVALHMRKSQCM